ncbi:MAG: D-glycero-alpha-D-manno-heptose-1,7-bisphosphate 7-phosphatase [Planctomycetota bacterium]|jgi:D-glycero-D-manno-heptose 1,7-bisphosphate phosphatase
MAYKAIFLDRDDTLVNDPGYIQRPEQVLLLPGAAEALIQLKKMGYLLIIVTNQSGVARGLVTEAQLEDIHRQLKSLLAAEGAQIDAIYYCPYHPEGTVKDFSMESNLRKPNAGMFFQAEGDLDIDLELLWTCPEKSAKKRTAIRNLTEKR